MAFIDAGVSVRALVSDTTVFHNHWGGWVRQWVPYYMSLHSLNNKHAYQCLRSPVWPMSFCLPNYLTQLEQKRCWWKSPAPDSPAPGRSHRQRSASQRCVGGERLEGSWDLRVLSRHTEYSLLTSHQHEINMLFISNLSSALDWKSLVPRCSL